MTGSSRFAAPSGSVGLGKLLRRGQRGLWAGLALALAAHFLAAQWERAGQEHRAAKPLTTKFVKRAPRLTKPLEMKKRPRPRQRVMRRKMVAVQARGDRGQATAVRPSRLSGSLARPEVAVGRLVSLEAIAYEPQVAAQAVHTSKEAKSAVDMSLEMMDPQALDTGQYHAMVIQDPRDKRSLRGFFHLAVAYPVSALEWDYQRLEMARSTGAMRRLIDRMNEWTGVRCDLRGRYTFESPEFFRIPWVYLQIRFNMFPTLQEKANLGQYLLSGGFYFADGPKDMFHTSSDARNPAGYYSQKRFIADALVAHGVVLGKDWDWELLPNSHPLFHTYFDFDGPPPGYLMSSITVWGWGTSDVSRDLRGIILDGRLMCILTNQNYNDAWVLWGVQGGANFYPALAGWDPTRQLQFGVNTIIFALLQEGSITRRLMDMVQ